MAEGRQLRDMYLKDRIVHWLFLQPSFLTQYLKHGDPKYLMAFNEWLTG